jgi:hypothetical protein
MACLQNTEKDDEKQICNELTQFLNLNNITVIHLPNSDDRKKVHAFLESLKSLKIGKCSLRIICLKSEKRFVKNTKLCYMCDKKISFDHFEYHVGFLENNKDESYSTICPYCDEMTRIEPNYDCYEDYTYSYPSNNVIIIGNVMNNWRSPSHAKVIDDIATLNDLHEFKKIYNNNETYVLPNPNPSYLAHGKYVSKKLLTKYINEIVNMKHK